MRCGEYQSRSVEAVASFPKQAASSSSKKTTPDDPLLLLQHPFTPARQPQPDVLLWGAKRGREGVATRGKTGLIRRGRVFLSPCCSLLKGRVCSFSFPSLFVFRAHLLQWELRGRQPGREAHLHRDVVRNSGLQINY